jgi:hypothetical protein
MNENGRRRRWPAAEKLRIVLAGMQPGVEWGQKHRVLIRRVVRLLPLAAWQRGRRPARS